MTCKPSFKAKWEGKEETEKGQEGPEGFSSAWLNLEVTLHMSL